MDTTTLAMDKKSIQRYMRRAFLSLICVAAIGLGIYYLVSGEVWVKDNMRRLEELTYGMLAFMVLVISLIITYVVGPRKNYTDCFRVRRSYAYEIRKQSILIYSPIAAAFVCLIKAGTGYATLSQRTVGSMTHIAFFIVAYLLYTVIIAAAVTFCLTLSKSMYSLAVVVQAWLLVYVAVMGRIPVWLGIWNIKKAAMLGIAVACLWMYLLKRLKRLCLCSNLQ